MARTAFVDVHRAADIEPCVFRVIEGQKRILPATPEQSIFHDREAPTRERSSRENALATGGSGKSPGWIKWARISRLSTMRGPGLLKYADPSVAKMRPALAAGNPCTPSNFERTSASSSQRSRLKPQHVRTITSGENSSTRRQLIRYEGRWGFERSSLPPAISTNSFIQ